MNAIDMILKKLLTFTFPTAKYRQTVVLGLLLELESVATKACAKRLRAQLPKPIVLSSRLISKHIFIPL